MSGRRFVGRVVAAGAAAVLLAAGSTGCAAPRNALNTTASPCFTALPLAGEVVHGKGRLVGVRLVETAELARKVPEAAALGRRRLCGVAYRGEFGPGDVSGATTAHAGPFALVLVDAGERRVVAAYVLDDLPMRFTHWV